MRWTFILAAVLLAGCSRAPSPAPQPRPTPSAMVAARDLTGRWTGVEGMVLDVKREAERYLLTMQYDLDHRGTFPAQARGDALVFERDGRQLTLRPTNGTATGLRYLADKKDCLTVAPGEGYCR